MRPEKKQITTENRVVISSPAEQALETARMFGKRLGAIMLQPEQRADVPSAYALHQQALDTYGMLRRQEQKAVTNPLQTP